MTEGSIIPKELNDLLGVAQEPEVYEIEKGHLKRYVEAIDDRNPLWQDEAYARKSKYGSIIGPPLFHQDEPLVKIVDNILELLKEINYPLTGFLNAGMELEYHRPLMPGDVITTVAKLIDVYEKQRKKGKYLFWVVQATLTNQRGQLVSIHNHTFVNLDI